MTKSLNRNRINVHIRQKRRKKFSRSPIYSQYKIIALYKNYTHLYTVLLKKLGREIVIWYIYAGTCIYKFYETKRRNTMEQELLVAIPEAVANLTK